MLSKPNHQQEMSAAVDMCSKIGLQNSMHLYPKELSGGMKRRLAVGLSFIGGSQILFLDEPTTGIFQITVHLFYSRSRSR